MKVVVAAINQKKALEAILSMILKLQTSRRVVSSSSKSREAGGKHWSALNRELSAEPGPATKPLKSVDGRESVGVGVELYLMITRRQLSITPPHPPHQCTVGIERAG